MVRSDFLNSLRPVLSYLDYLFQGHLLGDQRLSAMSQARTQRRDTIILSVQRQGFPRLHPTCCSQFRRTQDKKLLLIITNLGETLLMFFKEKHILVIRNESKRLKVV